MCRDWQTGPTGGRDDGPVVHGLTPNITDVEQISYTIGVPGDCRALDRLPPVFNKPSTGVVQQG